MRTINKIVEGQRKEDGAGVKLVRVFGYHDVKDFDPFLMLDAFIHTILMTILKDFRGILIVE